MKLASITRNVAPDFRKISPEKSIVLPKVAMLLPAFFWLALFGILLTGLIMGKMGASRTAAALETNSNITEIKGKISIIDRQIEILNAELGRAETLYNWISSTPMVQPFIAGYFESFSDSDTISRFSMIYSKDVPGQFNVQTVYQGDVPSITSLFQKSTVSSAKKGWNLALAERSVDGNTVVIESFARVLPKQPWALFGQSEANFNKLMDPPESTAPVDLPEDFEFPGGSNPFEN